MISFKEYMSSQRSENPLKEDSILNEEMIKDDHVENLMKEDHHIKEEVVDAGIKLLRRRVIVADQRGITVYEGTPTFASDDQVLIKEGQYQVDKLGNVGTSDEGNSAPTNQQIIDEMNELGFNPDDVTVTPNDID
jgi:hypothetical protein